MPPFDAGLETGEWIFNNLRNFDPPTPPEILDPQESIQAFGQQRFEARGIKWKTCASRWDRIARKNSPRAMIHSGLPKPCRADLGRAGFNAFNLAGLLHPGRNTIAIRLDRLVLSDPAVWPGQVAVNGEVSYADGRRGCLVSDGAWSSREGGAALHSSVSAIAMRAARVAEETLPVLKYQGVPSPRDSLPAWTIPAALAASLALLVVAGLLTIVRLVFRRREGGVRMGLRPSPVAVAAALLRDALVPFTVVLGTVILLCAALGERSEQLWFLRPDTWRWSLCRSPRSWVLALAFVRLLGLSGRAWLRKTAVAAWYVVRELPRGHLWWFAIAGLLLLGLYLRGYALDFQGVAEDEYASVEAILSIARTGVPSYVPPAVWYTRSPLYHYLTAGVVRLFGENLWSLRLPAAAFGVGTCLLIYFCGSRLFRRPWLGMAAMAMATLHPEMIFSGHQVRFYEQQQFFSLLMFFCFCKGFVLQSAQSYRYLTLAAFLAAVLSQEITAVAALQLTGGYLLFAANEPWRRNFKLIIVTACVVAVIGLDWLVYQTHCMTRLEGFGPTMQAEIGPHFWEPYNFVTLFLGYSRLHVVLTAMFFLGLPAVLRERNRVSLALHFFLLSGIVLTNLLVTKYRHGYQRWLFPLAVDSGP